MILKHPCAIDFYGLNTLPDLSIYNPVIAFLKASEGDFVDFKFVERVKFLRDNNIRVGCYHFHRKSVNTQTQIDIFTNICEQAGITESDVLVGDFEEEGQTESQLKNWLEGVRVSFPNNLILIYSRKLILDAIPVSNNYFQQYPVWTAGYPSNPDLYDTVPSWYVPDQTKWGKVWCWQYADTSIGVNLVSPDFETWLGISTPEEPKINEWLFKIKPENIVRAEVTGYVNNKTVEYAAQEFHKTIQEGNHSLVINGDGWHTNGLPNGDWVVNGVWKHIQDRDSYSPRITFDANQKGAISGARGEYWFPSQQIDMNAFGLTRRLVKDGEINPAFVDPNELNSRTTFGFTPDGTLVIYICDGWDINKVTGEAPKGKKIVETGKILIDNDVIEGGDGDGGGSVTFAIDGIVINDYNDDGLKVMRPVVNHLCLELNVNPLEGDIMSFLATVKVGAPVYSPDGARPWGSVSSSMPQPMTVVGSIGDKYKISNPLWENGKEWTTPQSNVTEYVEPEPPEPPTTGTAFPDEIIVRIGTETKSYDPRT